MKKLLIATIAALSLFAQAETKKTIMINGSPADCILQFKDEYFALGGTDWDFFTHNSMYIASFKTKTDYYTVGCWRVGGYSTTTSMHLTKMTLDEHKEGLRKSDETRKANAGKLFE
jgi:hypothetical protein